MENEVNAVINNICEKLGYAASEITPEFARCMIARGVFGMIAGIFILGLFILLGVMSLKSFKALSEHDRVWNSFRQTCGIMIAGVGILITMVILCLAGQDLIGWIVAPRASMLQYVLSMIE